MFDYQDEKFNRGVDLDVETSKEEPKMSNSNKSRDRADKRQDSFVLKGEHIDGG
jgi:hypothetical protein